MIRRPMVIASMMLLSVLGTACGTSGGASGPSVGDAAGSATVTSIDAGDELPSQEFCDLVMNEPSTSVISENVAHYEGLLALAPEGLKPDIDAIIDRYLAHADAGEDSVTISADPEAQPHLMELVGVALECEFD